MTTDTDDLFLILTDADYIDRVIALLKPELHAPPPITVFPRSPRAGGAQSSAPSLPAAGAGHVDSRHDFDRDSQATGV